MTTEFDIDLYWIEDTKTILIGMNIDSISLTEGTNHACCFPVGPWMEKEQIFPDEIEEIAITNKQNFKAIIKQIKDHVGLWDEFLKWRKNKDKKKLAEVVSFEDKKK